MKRIEATSATRELLPLVIYLDQLEAVVDLLHQISAQDIRIATEDFEFDDLESDFTNAPIKESNNISITARSPHVSIDLSKSGARIYVGAGDVQGEGLAQRISQLLLTGDRQYVWLLDRPWVGWLLAPIAVLIGKLVSLNVGLIAGVILVILVLGILARDKKLRLERYTRIVFQYQKDDASFWSRNRDKIYLLLIGATVGAIFTTAINWISRQISSQ